MVLVILKSRSPKISIRETRTRTTDEYDRTLPKLQGLTEAFFDLLFTFLRITKNCCRYGNHLYYFMRRIFFVAI